MLLKSKSSLEVAVAKALNNVIVVAQENKLCFFDIRKASLVVGEMPIVVEAADDEINDISLQTVNGGFMMAACDDSGCTTV